MSRGSALIGWGVALPERVVTNAEFEARLDTNDAWIVERTGIMERRMGSTTGALAVQAGRAALDQAGVRAADIDLLILATTTPDQIVPATSATVTRALGIGGGGMDLNASCSGFVYALVTANALVGAGSDRILVIGSDTLSRIVDQDDRSTAVLFGDGAGAVVIEATPGEGQLVSWDLGVDGSAATLLDCDHGGFVRMEGREVFRRAVRAMVTSAELVMERAKLGPDDIALCVPHQANSRIVEAANARIGIPMSRTSMVVHRTGNTSAASIPLALADAADAGRLATGDHILLCGFGAGMTWASAILRWGPGDR
ncbi:MAG: beta-ketoacyl-ACP synthase III [Acidimicrobiales bacterium]